MPRIYSLFFLIFTFFAQIENLEAQVAPPNITNAIAYSKALELFQAHIRYKEMSPEIAQRALGNFMEELDPLKAYLTKEEIAVWLFPSDSLLNEIVLDFKNKKFTQFELIYAAMLTAIERRNVLEERVDNLKPPLKPMTAKEVHKADWASSVDELQLKLLNIRHIQTDAATRLPTQDQRDLFKQRMTKRRIKYEKGLIQESKGEQRKQILATFLKAVASSLDDHTIYFTANEAKQFLIQVQQRLFGIGAQLRDDLNGFTIVDIIEGGPAFLEGSLKVNDKVIAVDHEAVIGYDILEAIELIRGVRGTPLILTVVREGKNDELEQKLDIEITRDEVVLKESRFEAKTLPYGDSTIGYLALHSFYQDPTRSSSTDLEASINEMRTNSNLKGIILDLRYNSGGVLTQAIEVTGLFIKKGVVASIMDYNGKIQRLRNLSNTVAWNGPLIVLINKTSASASEIVAMTLSDYGRAILIGDETSFGKGTYQTFTFDGNNPDKVNPEGEYKVTRGCYYTVSGKTPQQVGVRSDIIVPGFLSESEIGEQYSKYPIPNNTIEASFVDTMDDVPHLYRMRLKKALGKDIQQQNTKLYGLIEPLAINSQKRIKASKNYQSFLQELKNQNKHELNLNLIGKNDLQLDETVNIMKEYIFFQSQQ